MQGRLPSEQCLRPAGCRLPQCGSSATWPHKGCCAHRSSPPVAPPPHPPPRTSDVLLSSATVREAITTSALLKLPRAMPVSDKLARVDAILKELVRPSEAGAVSCGVLAPMRCWLLQHACAARSSAPVCAGDDPCRDTSPLSLLNTHPHHSCFSGAPTGPGGLPEHAGWR